MMLVILLARAQGFFQSLCGGTDHIIGAKFDLGLAQKPGQAMNIFVVDVFLKDAVSDAFRPGFDAEVGRVTTGFFGQPDRLFIQLVRPQEECPGQSNFFFVKLGELFEPACADSE